MGIRYCFVLNNSINLMVIFKILYVFKWGHDLFSDSGLASYSSDLIFISMLFSSMFFVSLLQFIVTFPFRVKKFIVNV